MLAIGIATGDIPGTITVRSFDPTSSFPNHLGVKSRIESQAVSFGLWADWNAAEVRVKIGFAQGARCPYWPGRSIVPDGGRCPVEQVI